MNTKLVAGATLAMGTTVLGAVYFFNTTGASQPGQGSDPFAGQISSDTGASSLPPERVVVDEPEREVKLPKTNTQNSTAGGGWNSMIARMGEFDTDGDGFLSDLEKLAMGVQLKNEWMSEHDLDGDGEMSPEEWRAFRQSRFEKSARGQELMRQFDLDGDGQLNAEEQAALDAHNAQVSEQKRQTMLDQYDADGDGQISNEERRVQREEQRQFWENAKQEATENFDLDGDGELNIEESQNAWDAWIEQQSINDFIGRFDTNNDGVMGAADYNRFITDYSNGNLRADVNGDGILNTLDVTAYTDLVTRSNN
jgi:Ca2+-binding EF-hand superfamily protein